MVASEEQDEVLAEPEAALGAGGELPAELDRRVLGQEQRQDGDGAHLNPA